MSYVLVHTYVNIPFLPKVFFFKPNFYRRIIKDSRAVELHLYVDMQKKQIEKIIIIIDFFFFLSIYQDLPHINIYILASSTFFHFFYVYIHLFKAQVVICSFKRAGRESNGFC